MKILFTLVLLVLLSVGSWAIPYDTAGVYAVSERTVNIPTLPGGSTSTMSNSKIYYPSEGSGVAPGAVPCPIVVFGHGFNISIDQYVSYGRHLASWGYVVVVPTISNPFPLPSHYGRAIDMKAAGRYVAGLDTTASDIFYGKLDRWNWAFAGHSMGGSIACLAADTLRISDTLKCVISFSGPQSTPSTHPQHIQQPLLILEGTNDGIAPWNEVCTGFYRGGTQSATFAVIDGANHSQFTDSWTSPLGDGSATISRGLQKRYARRHLTAWLERYLKGVRTPLNYHCCFGDSVNGHSAMADTVSSRYINQPPQQTSLVNPFNFACLGTRQPSFTFLAYDDIDQLSYRMYLDDVPALSSPDSAAAGSGASGASVTFGWPQALAQDAVCYWRARARDGAGLWGPYSDIRSFTVDTLLGSADVSWRQSRGGQFASCSLSGVTISGDSLVPAGSSAGTVTSPEIDFRSLSGFLPKANWGFLKWKKGMPQDSVRLQVEYRSGSTWSLIPNSHLPGNASGFLIPEAFGFVSLKNLDTTLYRYIRLKAVLIPAAKGSPRPSLLLWEAGAPDSTFIGVAGPGPEGDPDRIRLHCQPTVGTKGTTIEFSLPQGTDYCLEAFNLLGQKVAEIAKGRAEGGRQKVIWTVHSGASKMAPGMYFIRMNSLAGKRITRFIILK